MKKLVFILAMLFIAVSVKANDTLLVNCEVVVFNGNEESAEAINKNLRVVVGDTITVNSLDDSYRIDCIVEDTLNVTDELIDVTYEFVTDKGIVTVLYRMKKLLAVGIRNQDGVEYFYLVNPDMPMAIKE